MDQRIKQILRGGLLFSLSLVGCTVKNAHVNTEQAIDQLIQESIDNNRELNRLPKKSMQTNVARALLPQTQVTVSGSRKVKSDPNEPKFDITVDNVSMQEFFAGLVKTSGYNIVLAPRIKGNVTVSLKQVTVPQLLDVMRDNYDLEYELTDYGYRVYQRGLETRVFRLDYIDVERGGNSSTKVASGSRSKGGEGGGDSNVVSTKNDSKFWDLLKTNLEAFVTKDSDGTVVVNPQAGTVVARAYPQDLRMIGAYLDRVQDIMHRQVIIEAKVVEVELYSQFRYGVDWSLMSFHQPVASAGVNEYQFNFGSGGNGTDSITNSASLMFNAKRHKTSVAPHFKGVLQALNMQGKVNVLSSPRISTLNNQKAVIRVGNDAYFVTEANNDNSSSAGGGNNNHSSYKFEQFFSGVSLDVTPQVDDDDNITLHIHPVISDTDTKKITITQNNSPQEFPLAKTEVRESDSVVRARSGQVIVIGGLTKERSHRYKNGVPVLDQVSVLGDVTGSRDDSAAKTELVILLRPIVASRTSWDKTLRDIGVNISRINNEPEFKYKLKLDRPDRKVNSPAEVAASIRRAR